MVIIMGVVEVMLMEVGMEVGLILMGVMDKELRVLEISLRRRIVRMLL